MTTELDTQHIPAFTEPLDRLRRCMGCGTLAIVNHKKRCVDCDHAERLQGFVNAIAQLRIAGNDADRDTLLQAIYESAIPLVRE